MALEAKVKQDAPKVDYFDGLVDRNLLTNLRTTAKQLNIPQKQFTAHLLTDDLFTVKDCKGNKWTGQQTFVTPRGKETFKLFYKKLA